MPDSLWSAEVDEGQINQVISNLFLNAIEAMPEGGIIRVRAENTTLSGSHDQPLKPGRYIGLSIQDRGIGIKKENLFKVFDPYFSTKQSGRGLGLAVVNSIIGKHGGHITVESEPGTGTVFHIYLPACDADPLAEKDSFSEDSIPGEGKILVMDDEEIIRDLVGQFLSSLGYDAKFAKDGVEAIDLYRQASASGKPFDAVILDLTVPGGMGGKETVKRLLEIDPDAKAIVSSGYSNAPVMADYERYGFAGVISKPYQIGSLSAILKRVITMTR